MMKTLAVTGGIGSGKSYIVRMFAALGVPVYDADSRTKELYASEPELLAGLKSVLGDAIVRDGVLDRQYMASRIFSDKSLLRKVEELVFPQVIEDFRKWKISKEVQLREHSGRFVIMESAIYLEKPSLYGTADRVLTVTCPVDVRVRRVMERSAMSREQVLERMANQCSDLFRISKSDFTIVSDFAHPLLPQVWDVFKKMNEI